MSVACVVSVCFTSSVLKIVYETYTEARDLQSRTPDWKCSKSLWWVLCKQISVLSLVHTDNYSILQFSSLTLANTHFLLITRYGVLPQQNQTMVTSILEREEEEIQYLACSKFQRTKFFLVKSSEKVKIQSTI